MCAHHSVDTQHCHRIRRTIDWAAPSRQCRFEEHDGFDDDDDYGGELMARRVLTMMMMRRSQRMVDDFVVDQTGGDGDLPLE